MVHSNTSTASKDGGVGLPTFAVLSAEIQVKSSAEQALSTICNNLTNFPPKSSSMKLARISTIWDEIKENNRFTKLQDHLLQSSPKCIAEGPNQALRYYSLDNRVIIAITERPQWSIENDESSDENTPPAIGISIRDSSGKFSWYGKCRYRDETLINHNNDKVVISSALDLTHAKNVDRLEKTVVTNLDNEVYDQNHSSSLKVYAFESANDHNIPQLEYLIESALEDDTIQTNFKAQILLDSENGKHNLDMLFIINQRFRESKALGYIGSMSNNLHYT